MTEQSLPIQNRSAGVSLLAGIAFSCLAALKILERAAWMASLQFVPSTDGYFYLQEIAYRVRHGRSYYGITSLFFSVAELFSRALSLQELTAFHLMVFLGLVLISCGLVWIAYRRDRWYLAPALVYLCWCSDLIFYRHYAFPKLGFGIGLFVLGMGGFSRAKGDLKTKLCSCVLFVAAAATHQLCALMALPYLIFTGKELGLSKALQLGLLLAVTGVGVLMLSRGEVQQLFQFGGMDTGIMKTCRIAHCSPFEWSETGVFLALWAALTVLGWRLRIRSVPFWVILLLGIALNLPIFSTEGELAYRLAAASLPLLLAALALGSREHFAVGAASVLCGATILVSTLFLTHRDYTARESIAPTLFHNRAALVRWIPDNALLVAPHGTQFTLTYFLQRSAARIPPRSLSSRPLFRVMQIQEPRRCFELSSKSEVIPPDTDCVALHDHWIITRSRG